MKLLLKGSKSCYNNPKPIQHGRKEAIEMSKEVEQSQAKPVHEVQRIDCLNFCLKQQGDGLGR